MPAAVKMNARSSTHFVIVGNSAAGVNAVESIRRIAPDAPITVIGRENFPAYSPVLTTCLIAGQVAAEQMIYRDYAWYKKHRVRLVLGTPVVRIDRSLQRVYAQGGESWGYDKLLLATGSSPVMPCLPGVNLDGVTGVRTLEDAKKISAALKDVRKAVILGGGLVGFKCAEALIHRGVTVEILIGSGSVLSRILDEDSAHRVRKFAESAGVGFRFNTQAAALEGTGRVESVTLDTGKALGCDLVIIAKGVRPNTDLAVASRLDCDRGILVDRFMRTSDPNIYAAGDVAQVPHVLNGTPILAAIWPEAAAQGGCAGYNMAGGCAGYPGALPRNSLTLFGLQLASVGETRPATERHRSVHFGSGSGPVKRFVLEADRLVGAVALGDIRYVGVYRKMVQQGVRVRKAEALLKPLCGYGEKQTIKTNGGAV